MTPNLPRYTPVLVADPAAESPAPAPVAAGGAGADAPTEARLTTALTLAMVERVRRASAVQVRKDALDLIEDWNILNLANAKLRDRAEAVEAERDRLALEVAVTRDLVEAVADWRATWDSGPDYEADAGVYLAMSHDLYRAALSATPTLSVRRPNLERARTLADDHDSANVDPESDGSDYTAATLRALCDYIDAIQLQPPAAEAVTGHDQEADHA